MKKRLTGLLVLILCLGCRNFTWPKFSDPTAESMPVPAAATSLLPPSYGPPQGLYNAGQVVSFSGPAGATFCYTINGTVPDCDPTTAICTNGSTYAAPVAIGVTQTLKSLSCKAGANNSSVTSGTYTIDLISPGPVLSFVAVPGDTEMALSWLNPADADFAGVKILRKTGSYPANASDGNLVFNANGTSAIDTGLTNGTLYYYSAFAYDTAGNFATASQATATPSGGTVNPTLFSPAAGVFNSGQNVTVSTTTPGSLICFTTTGVTPACDAVPTCTSGAAYVAPVAMAATGTLKAIACKNGSVASGVATGTYTIDATPPLISAVQPASSAIVNSTQVSYTLTETCATGSVTWTQTGGISDPTPLHTQALTGSELFSGAHTGITLINDPMLTEGSVYGVTFNCTDTAGNAAASVTSTSVLYNAQPPGNVTAFRAIAGDTRVTLVWMNPPDGDFAGVKILRKTGSLPVNNTDGTVVYNSNGVSAVDTGLTNGTLYYYKAFTYDTGTNFAGGIGTTQTPFAACGGGACRIFVTALTFNGNLGGISGADAKCNADAAKPNASSYKAMLAETNSRRGCTAASCGGATGVEQSQDWPLFPGKNYVRSDGTTAIATASINALLPTTLTNTIATGGGQNWTGLNTDWTQAVDNCNAWSDGSSGYSGTRGTQNTTTTAAWSNGSNPCVTSRGIYCVEQ